MKANILEVFLNTLFKFISLFCKCNFISTVKLIWPELHFTNYLIPVHSLKTGYSVLFVSWHASQVTLKLCIKRYIYHKFKPPRNQGILYMPLYNTLISYSLNTHKLGVSRTFKELQRYALQWIFSPTLINLSVTRIMHHRYILYSISLKYDKFHFGFIFFKDVFLSF